MPVVPTYGTTLPKAFDKMLARAPAGRNLVTDSSLVNWLLMGFSVVFGCATGTLVLSETLVGSLLLNLLGSFFNNPDIQHSSI